MGMMSRLPKSHRAKTQFTSVVFSYHVIYGERFGRKSKVSELAMLGKSGV